VISVPFMWKNGLQSFSKSISYVIYESMFRRDHMQL
jgi:hypothetical protein